MIRAVHIITIITSFSGILCASYGGYAAEKNTDTLEHTSTFSLERLSQEIDTVHTQYCLTPLGCALLVRCADAYSEYPHVDKVLTTLTSQYGATLFSDMRAQNLAGFVSAYARCVELKRTHTYAWSQYVAYLTADKVPPVWVPGTVLGISRTAPETVRILTTPSSSDTAPQTSQLHIAQQVRATPSHKRKISSITSKERTTSFQQCR